MKRLRTLAVNPLLALSSGVLLLGARAGLSRWVEPARPAAARPAEHFPDWAHFEGQFFRFGASAPSWPPASGTNRDGLRDRHRTLDRAPGRLRLVALGDSVTYGYGLEAEQAWPQRLEELLLVDGGLVEVFNAGVPGWSTRQQRIAYRDLLRKYRPDVVLLAVCLNDIPELSHNLARPAPWLAWLHARSALVRRAVRADAREIESVRALLRAPDHPRARAAFASFFDELHRLHAELRADGVALALVVFPYRFQLEPGAPEPVAQRRLAEFAAAAGLAHLDLLPMLRPLGAAAFMDYCHLNARGTQAVAAAVAASRLIGAPPSHGAVLRAARVAPEEADALIEATRHPAPELRAAAAWALGRTGAGAGPLQAVGRLLADQDALVRFEALGAVRRAGAAAEPARARLLHTLDDPSEALRLAAAEALWALPQAADEAPPLAARLGHDDAYVAHFAEESLVRLGAGAVDALAPALGAPTARARRRAARALGRIGPAAAPARAALASLLEDRDPGVRRQATQALRRLDAARVPVRQE